MNEGRPPVGTPVRIPHTGEMATVVPTHWQAPTDEVDVMIHGTGSVRTVRLAWIETEETS